jgi:membrane fusion protein (multidrug efflux system)
MRPRALIIGAVVLLVAAAFGVGYWMLDGRLQDSQSGIASAQTTPTAGSGAPQAVPVEAVEVAVGTVTDDIEVIGTLRSDESVVIRPEIGGRIAEILFEEGGDVKAGTPLLKLDGAVIAAELKQAKAALTLSQVTYKRAVELLNRKAASVATRDETLAKLLTDEAIVILMEARLAKMTLMAPFDGVLGLRKVSVGDYVTPGQDMVNLESIASLKVDFRVPEIFLAALKPGQKIEVTVDAFPGRRFEGVVYAIDPLVDEAGRSVALRARIPNLDRELRPGVFVSVTLVVERRENAVMVPEQSMVARGGEQFVYRIVDGVAVLTGVTTGKRRNAQVEIVKGLAPGDVVVTAGQMKLRDGVAVTVLPPPAEG